MDNVYAIDPASISDSARAAALKDHGVVLVSVDDPRDAEQMAMVLGPIVAGITSALAVGEALATADAVPGKSTLEAIREREVAWRDIEARYGLLTSTDVASAAGSRSSNPSEYAAGLRRHNRVIATRRARRLLFPGFQFTHDGRPRPEIKPVIEVFRDSDWDDDSIILWFTAPNGYLDDDEPLHRLDRTPDAVLEAARNAAADW